jgi:hypothetical protein
MQSRYIQTQVSNQTFEDQFDTLHTAVWENKENPQAYDELEAQVVSPDPRRHILGLVGGNEVATVAASKFNVVNGQQADVESDLRGITRPITKCPWKDYQPQAKGATVIQRENVKNNFMVDSRLYPLRDYQMWAYAASYQPEPMVKETCGRPEKY